MVPAGSVPRESDSREPMSRKRRILFISIGILALGAGSVWGWRRWAFWRSHVVTDNAYVGANVALVTPRVAGTVVWVSVEDNWRVEPDQVIVRLDPAEFDVKLREAEAAVALAHERIGQARAAVRAARANIQLALAELSQAETDYERAAALVKSGAAPLDELDRATTALKAARARVAAARRAEERARAALGIPLDAPDAESSAVRRAQALRDAAALARSYTDIHAPIEGWVAKRSVQVGERVQPGQPLMAIVPLEQAYVDANFKETKLAGVRVGQPAQVTLDLYPDTVYHGVVDSLAPGTGSAFAIFPPENATGNWVKVVQRVPVRITFTRPLPAERPLRVGLSAVVSIDTSDQDGALLTSLSQSRPHETQAR